MIRRSCRAKSSAEGSTAEARTCLRTPWIHSARNRCHSTQSSPSLDRHAWLRTSNTSQTLTKAKFSLQKKPATLSAWYELVSRRWDHQPVPASSLSRVRTAENQWKQASRVLESLPAWMLQHHHPRLPPPVPWQATTTGHKKNSRHRCTKRIQKVASPSRGHRVLGLDFFCISNMSDLII